MLYHRCLNMLHYWYEYSYTLVLVGDVSSMICSSRRGKGGGGGGRVRVRGGEGGLGIGQV